MGFPYGALFSSLCFSLPDPLWWREDVDFFVEGRELILMSWLKYLWGQYPFWIQLCIELSLFLVASLTDFWMNISSAARNICIHLWSLTWKWSGSFMSHFCFQSFTCGGFEGFRLNLNTELVSEHSKVGITCLLSSCIVGWRGIRMLVLGVSAQFMT